MDKAFLDTLPGPLGHVLHIGAGQGGDVDGYLAAGAQAVTLVEPDPEALAHLRMTVAGQDRVHVIGAAISAMPGNTDLYRFNFPDLNSLRPAQGLETVFPGLEILAREPVTVRGPAEIVSGIDLAEGQAHVLVIEAPGEAMSLLQALEEAGLLKAFSGLCIQAGAERHYQDETPASEIVGWLREAGFPSAREEGTTDPDFPYIIVVRDPQAEVIAALQAELEEARAEIDAEKKRAVQARREKGYAQSSITRLEKKADTALEQIASLEQGLSEREAALEAARQDLEAEAAARKAAEARVAELEPLVGERDAAVSAHAALEKTLSNRETMLETARQRITELKAERDQFKAETQSAKRALEARIAGLEEEKSSLEQGLSERKAALEAATVRIGELETARDGLQEQLVEAGKLEMENDRLSAQNREEMLRTEGQIELIKDLLLRGPEL